MTHTTHRQFLHDERYYPDPDKFDPSRYSRSKESGLNEDDYNPLNVVFGFGRRWALAWLIMTRSIAFWPSIRICPGKHFAEQGLWLTLACILAAFDVIPPLDGDGREYLPEIAFKCGLSRWVLSWLYFPQSRKWLLYCHSEPVDFDCRIVPRSESYVKLIREEMKNVANNWRSSPLNRSYWRFRDGLLCTLIACSLVSLYSESKPSKHAIARRIYYMNLNVSWGTRARKLYSDLHANYLLE